MSQPEEFTLRAPEARQRQQAAQKLLAEKIRIVPDFPEEGIVFEDLTPALADAEAFRAVVRTLADAAAEMQPDIIAGLDARGFLLGSAVAYEMGLGILAVRKGDKLPPPVFQANYSLEYGTATLEIPADGMDLHGHRVLLLDDVLATGGTLGAARKLLEQAGATVCGLAVVLEVEGLNGRQRFPNMPFYVLGTDHE